MDSKKRITDLQAELETVKALGRKHILALKAENDELRGSLSKQGLLLATFQSQARAAHDNVPVVFASLLAVTSSDPSTSRDAIIACQANVATLIAPLLPVARGANCSACGAAILASAPGAAPALFCFACGVPLRRTASDGPPPSPPTLAKEAQSDRERKERESSLNADQTPPVRLQAQTYPCIDASDASATSRSAAMRAAAAAIRQQGTTILTQPSPTAPPPVSPVTAAVPVQPLPAHLRPGGAGNPFGGPPAASVPPAAPTTQGSHAVPTLSPGNPFGSPTAAKPIATSASSLPVAPPVAVPRPAPASSPGNPFGPIAQAPSPSPGQVPAGLHSKGPAKAPVAAAAGNPFAAAFGLEPLRPDPPVAQPVSRSVNQHEAQLIGSGKNVSLGGSVESTYPSAHVIGMSVGPGDGSDVGIESGVGAASRDAAELSALMKLGIGELKKRLKDAGVSYDRGSVTEKGDLVRLLASAGQTQAVEVTGVAGEAGEAVDAVAAAAHDASEAASRAAALKDAAEAASALAAQESASRVAALIIERQAAASASAAENAAKRVEALSVAERTAAAVRTERDAHLLAVRPIIEAWCRESGWEGLKPVRRAVKAAAIRASSAAPGSAREAEGSAACEDALSWPKRSLIAMLSSARSLESGLLKASGRTEDEAVSALLAGLVPFSLPAGWDQRGGAVAAAAVPDAALRRSYMSAVRCLHPDKLSHLDTGTSSSLRVVVCAELAFTVLSAVWEATQAAKDGQMLAAATGAGAQAQENGEGGEEGAQAAGGAGSPTTRAADGGVDGGVDI